MRAKPLVFREHAAVCFLDLFLNGRFGAVPDDAKNRIVELISALNLALYPGRELDQTEWKEADKRVNRLLDVYTTVPRLTRDDEGYGAIEHEVLTHADKPYDSLEVEAVTKAILLANQGVLHQIVTCPICGTMVVPTKINQRTCGDPKCSQKAYEKTPDFRSKRNATARNRYLRARERDEQNKRKLGSRTFSANRAKKR